MENELENEPEIEPYMMRLRYLRKEQNFTQTDIAEILGISQGMYHRYETGKTALPVRHLMILCDLYRVSVDDVLGMRQRRRREIPLG
jgi:transcriptional regulator with XRE-family HTH domain